MNEDQINEILHDHSVVGVKDDGNIVVQFESIESANKLVEHLEERGVPASDIGIDVVIRTDDE